MKPPQTEAARRELARIDRDLDKLVQALLDGVPAASVKAKMERLETRKIELTAGLAAETPSPLLHPRMAEIYHLKVGDLHAALNADDVTRVEATGILRSLIDATRIELRGDLAGILNVATKEKSPSFADGLVSQVEMVAGACNQRYLHLAASRIPRVPISGAMERHPQPTAP